MIKENNTLGIIRALRKDARMNMVDLAKATNLSRAVVFRRLKYIENNFVKKYTSLVDFSKTEYKVRAVIYISSNGKRLAAFLKKNPHINSAFSLSGRFDFMIEVFFRNLSDLASFEDRLHPYCTCTRTHFIVEEIKMEDACAA